MEQNIKSEDRFFSKNVTLALKGTAIILMLFHHLFSQSESFEDLYGVIFSPFTREQINNVSRCSKICVSMFVFLTGYGLALSMRGKSLRDREKYAVRHYLKLEISFLLVFAAALLTSFLRSDRLSVYLSNGRASAVRYIAIDAFGFANFAGTPSYNETWWYMAFAVLLIFLMPVITTLVQKYGISIVVLAALIKSFGVDKSKAFAWYLLPLTLGAWLADRDLILRIRSKISTLPAKMLFMAVMLLLSISAFAANMRWGTHPWSNTFIVLTLTLFLFTLIDLCHVRLRILEFLGRYSMNIFMFHTLIYEYYFTSLVYAPRHFILIWLVCLGLSLAAALPLGLLQKFLLGKLHIA